MGLARRPHKVNLIVGLLSNDPGSMAHAVGSLRKVFGRTDFESPVTDFTHTDYYEKEMGRGLKRQFLSFEKLFDLKGICRAKVRSNELEKRLAVHGRRTVNIDPGYLDLSKLVLFSTKDYSHRIYLDKGIFAEVTMFYKDKCFTPWPWTYPDYKSAEYIEMFNGIRDIYKAKLQC